MNFKNFILITSVILVLSCKDRNTKIENTVSQIIGNKIELIDTLTCYSVEKGFHHFSFKNKSKYKIVTYIDASCGSCLYRLDKMKDFISSNNLKDIPLLIYMHAYEKKQISYALEDIDFPYPVIVDLKKIFFKKNNLNPNKFYHTFLINEHNKIILVGDPILSPKIKELFVNSIKN